MATARSIWNGALVLGDAVLAVKVFAATESHTPRFRELHDADGAPIEHKLVAEGSGREVSRDKVAKAYEPSSGKMVVLTDEEIKAVRAAPRKAIDVEAFVPAAQIDPVFYDRAYFLGAADEEAGDGLAALSRAMFKREVVGLARVSLRGKEQLVAIRPGDRCLRMSTMRYADEVVGPADVAPEAPGKKPSDREKKMARDLIDGLQRRFDPGDYSDQHRERVETYAKAKASGEEPELEELQDVEGTDDLLGALTASLEAARG